MNKALGLIIVIILVAIPATAQKVYVDYSPLADFDSYKTFAWGPTPQASLQDNNPLNHSRIKHGIEYYLIKGGMSENLEDPDLYVTYYGEAEENVSINTSLAGYGGYGYGAGWTWDPYWGSSVGMTTTTPIVHEAGTLVIDLWDAKTKKIVWRGTMTATIPANPQKGAKKIENGLEKIVKKWQKMRAKELKEAQ
jgi:hypothetical protein